MKKIVCALLLSVLSFTATAQEYHFEMTKKSANFHNGVEDEVAYIDLGDIRIWGWFEVTLTGAYSYQCTTGKYTKRYQIGNNPGGSLNSNKSSEVVAAHGLVPDQWKLGEVEINAQNHLVIPIYHLVTTKNYIVVNIKGVSTIDFDQSLFTITAPIVIANNEVKDEIYYNNDFNVLGNLGIGTKDTKGFKLGVQGKIATEEVKVAQYNEWPDFVFEETYHLPSLEDIESHIDSAGHLPNIPSANHVEHNGFYLGEMNAKLLQKIEELTLYTIEQEKKIKAQEKEINTLKTLEQRISKLEELSK